MWIQTYELLLFLQLRSPDIQQTVMIGTKEKIVWPVQGSRQWGESRSKDTGAANQIVQLASSNCLLRVSVSVGIKAEKNLKQRTWSSPEGSVVGFGEIDFLVLHWKA